MSTYLVSYDLRKPGKNYATLHEHLKSYANWAKPLESLWLVQTSASAAAVRDAIRQHMDNNDRVFVVDVTKQPAAWHGLLDDVSAWIKNNM